MAENTMNHILYTDSDNDRPDVICDSNGQVVLGLCKVCGKGECELEQPCYTPADLVTLRNKAFCFSDWIAKTNWVQEQLSTFPPSAVGRHRADIMADEIMRLRKLVSEQRDTISRMRYPDTET